MLTLNDGRSELWQWDTNRKLTVDADCSQIHFSNKVFGRSVDVDVVDGVANIPDTLLQTDKDLNVWAFVGTAENGYTKISKTFKVNRRNKPADYVFTPPEQTNLGELIERLDKIEESQDPDAIKNAVDDYLANNPIEIDETDPTVPEWAKKPTKPGYTALEVGALPADTVIPTIPDNVSAFRNDAGYLTEHQDLTGYATEQYVQGYAQPKGNYLTEVPAGYAKTEDIPTKPEDIGAQPKGEYLTAVPDGYATEEYVKNKIAEAELGGEEVDLSGYAKKSELPTKTSQLTNDSGYLTAVPDGYAKTEDIPKNPSDIGAQPAGNYALKSEIPTKVSQLQNDSGYLTEHQDISGKLDASALPTAINTALAQAKASGEFDGKAGVSATHSWNGTVLTVTSASGTSSADLKGAKGDKGEKGDRGEQGIQGLQGLKGETGAQGQKGADGTPATHKWNGTTLYITSASGTSSADLKGDKGDKGDTGATGAQGEPGKDGANGKDYVLTDEDKSEIMAMVIESLGGNPIFGVVDANNHIVLNGNLPDGTYSVKYEMEDGSKISIGNLVLDTNVYYSVTNNLTNCTSNNSATQAVQGESYSATITAKNGYELKSVTVTMGGSPVSVSGGEITIANVTGNIVITAVAEVAGPAYTNQIPLSTDASGNPFNGGQGWKTGYRLSLSSGGETAADGYECTGFIPVKYGDVIRIKNVDLTAENSTNMICYDSSKTPIKCNGSNNGGQLGVLFANGECTLNTAALVSLTTAVAFIRIGSKAITADSILTVNQEIV